MKRILVTDKIKKLSDSIASTSFEKVEHYFPIDRYFLEDYGYLEELKKTDPVEFLFYNLEGVNVNYTNHLILCLPELWDDIDYDDLVALIENFTNPFSFYTLIEFTYKYLEIDLLDEVFNNDKVKDEFKKHCIEYFPNIIATFYLDEDDYEVFDENLMGVHINDWSYTKQRLLVDKRIKPAVSAPELAKRLKGFEERIQVS